MDNLTHTLTGAAIGAAGLSKRTRLAVPALLLGANAPDIDAIAYFIDPTLALDVRRGITHGVLAMLVLPFVLAGLLMGIDALARRFGWTKAAPANPRALLLVCAVAILSHPLLDLMNTYGVRLLAPLSWRWFYGDTLFIVDPWVLLALTVGLIVTRKAGAFGARTALAVTFAYVVFMVSISAVARWWVRDGALALLEAEPQRVLASPVPLNPFSRDIVVETDSAYFPGRVTFFPPRVTLFRRPIPRGADLIPLVQHDLQAQRFLRWSRFPVLTRDGDIVILADARYGGPNTSWARVEVVVPRQATSARPTPDVR